MVHLMETELSAARRACAARPAVSSVERKHLAPRRASRGCHRRGVRRDGTFPLR